MRGLAAQRVATVNGHAPPPPLSDLLFWPKVLIQRPHTQTWHILIHELRDLESWVRQTALPMLIAGSTDVSPLPPHLDITVGYADFRTALDAASPAPAADRLEKLVGAEMACEGLPGILLLHPRGVPHGQALTAWAATLSDDEVLQRFESLYGLEWHDLDATVRAMIDEALNGHRGPTGPLHPAPRPHAQP